MGESRFVHRTHDDTIDGWLKSGVHQLRLVAYPDFDRVSYIPGGAGFQPSAVAI